MAITVSGILRSPQGLALQNAELLFEQTRTTEEVLQGTKFSINTQPDGTYSSTLGVGVFTFKVRFQEETQYRAVASNIIVTQEMEGYSLNEIVITQQTLEDIDYDLLKQVLELRNEAEQFQEQARISQESSSQSAQGASASQQQSLASENSSKQCETQAKQSEIAAHADMLLAEQHQQSALSSKNSAQASEVQATREAQEAQDSQAAALISETHAYSSQQQALQSEQQQHSSEVQASASQQQAANSESNATLKASQASNSQASASSSQGTATSMAAGAQSSQLESQNSWILAAAEASQAAASQSSANGSQTIQTDSAQQSASSAILSQKWAANPEDLEVSNGRFSALHYATKAAQSAQTAAGQLIWRGGWSAQGGTTPPTPIGATQDFYRISQAGVILGVQYDIGDYIHWDTTNSIWFKLDGTDSVISINGRAGQVIIGKADVGLHNVNNWGASSQVDNPSDSLYATTQAVYSINQQVQEVNQKLPTKLDTNANAVSATKLFTARKISGKYFDGTADITLTPGDIGALPTSTYGGTPAAAYFITAGAATEGTKIRLPFRTDSGRMVTFTVRVYQDYEHTDIQFSGYLYSLTDQWYLPKATMISGTASINVAVGRDADGIAYVWLAGGQYRGVAVINVVSGYTPADWNTGWAISVTDSAPTQALNVVLHPPFSKNNPPTATDVGALPISGGVLGGVLVVKDQLRVNGFGGNASVERSAVGSAACMDWVERGTGNWNFSQSTGAGAEVKRLMTLTPSGDLSTTGHQVAITTQWATSSDGNSNIAIEAPAGGSPCLTFKSPNIPATVKGLTFNGSEVLFGQRAVGDFRVSGTHGLLFAPFADAAGVSWAAGMDPNTGIFAIKKFSSGTWQWDAILLNNANQLTLNGDTTIEGFVSGSKAIFSRSVDGSSGLAFETPVGGAPYISAKNAGASRKVLEFTNDITTNHGRLISTGTVGATSTHSPMLELHHPALVAYGMYIEGANGQLRIGQTNGSGAVAKVLLAIESGGNATFTGELHSGSGGGRLGATGMVYGGVWGGDGSIAGWCQRSFAPISDATMKRNIAPSTKSALDDVAKLVFVSYDWDPTNPLTLGKKSAHIGVTAQQVEEIDGSYVRDVETHAADGSVGASVKSLDLVNLLSLALKAIQEQQDQISDLKLSLSKLTL